MKYNVTVIFEEVGKPIHLQLNHRPFTGEFIQFDLRGIRYTVKILSILQSELSIILELTCICMNRGETPKPIEIKSYQL